MLVSRRYLRNPDIYEETKTRTMNKRKSKDQEEEDSTPSRQKRRKKVRWSQQLITVRIIQQDKPVTEFSRRGYQPMICK